MQVQVGLDPAIKGKQMAEIKRPLSPHLGIYKWQISNSMSILHRLTGVSLALAAVALIWWIVAVASGEGAYAVFQAFFAGPLGLLLLLAFSLSFFYHLVNGVRHLAWDVGFGFDRERAKVTGWIALVLALLAAVAFWIGVLA